MGAWENDEAPPAAMAYRSLRAYCGREIARQVDVAVEGLEHVPATGPVVVAARHFHHLYDGCAIGLAIPRHIHVLVAEDWVRTSLGRGLFERACRMARFPTVYRPQAADLRPDLRTDPAARAAFEAAAARALRRAAAETVALLRGGHVLLVFPEGYPNVDPGATPKRADADVLPFQPGFVRLVALAQADGRTRVPVVPAGLAYARGERWHLTLRFGAPLALEPGADRGAFLREVEEAVLRLSGLAPREAPDPGEPAPG